MDPRKCLGEDLEDVVIGLQETMYPTLTADHNKVLLLLQCEKPFMRPEVLDSYRDEFRVDEFSDARVLEKILALGKDQNSAFQIARKIIINCPHCLKKYKYFLLDDPDYTTIEEVDRVYMKLGVRALEF